MGGNTAIQINIKKTHLIAIAILLLVATATSTVNVRDSLSVFQDLDMNGNDITNIGNIEGYSSGSGESSSSPIYGSGTDGSIYKTGGSTNGVLYTTTYEIASDSTVSTSGTVIFANEEIIINGKLNGTGGGGSGWDGACIYGDCSGPEAPSPGVVTEWSSKDISDLSNPITQSFENLANIPWGGRGGGGGNFEYVDEGSDYVQVDSDTVGGDGGAMITLVAPKITVNGEIIVSGTDGEDGSECRDGEYRDDFAEAGADGGDAGSAILASPSISGTGSLINQIGHGGTGAECELGDSDLDDNGFPSNMYIRNGPDGSDGSSGVTVCYDNSNTIC